MLTTPWCLFNNQIYQKTWRNMNLKIKLNAFCWTLSWRKAQKTNTPSCLWKCIKTFIRALPHSKKINFELWAPSSQSSSLNLLSLSKPGIIRAHLRREKIILYLSSWNDDTIIVIWVIWRLNKIWDYVKLPYVPRENFS